MKPPFEPGEKLILARVERGEWDNLADDDFEHVTRRIGREVAVVAFDEEGRGLLEVEWREAIDGEQCYFSLLVEPSWVERAPT